MCVQSDGTISHAAHNLVNDGSEGQGWSASNGTGGTAVQDQGFPGITTQIYDYTEAASTAEHRVLVDVIASQPADVPVRYSAYFKPGTRNHFYIRASTNGSSRTASFNISDLTTSSETDTSEETIEDVGDGWYRCSAVFADNTSTSVACGCKAAKGGALSYLGDAGDVAFYLTGFMEQSLPAVDNTYFPTTNGPAYQLPYSWKLGDDRVTYESRGVHCEEARTNLRRDYTNNRDRCLYFSLCQGRNA
jgi:hypothetical protein